MPPHHNLIPAPVLTPPVRTAPLLGLLALGCASAPPPAPSAPPPIGAAATATEDLPRSSIAAILLHRQELGLTADQVDFLTRRDDALAKEDAALRARVAAGTSSATSSTPAPSGGMGGRHGRHGGQRPQPTTHAPDALTQLDDNDTRAYLEIEEQVLTEAQRPRAREIASTFREALYDRQHPSASRGGGDAGSLSQ
jgi:hypothetical protein